MLELAKFSEETCLIFHEQGDKVFLVKWFNDGKPEIALKAAVMSDGNIEFSFITSQGFLMLALAAMNVLGGGDDNDTAP